MAYIGARDARGEWQPAELPKPGPLFSRPFQPLEVLKFLIGLAWPMNIIYAGIAFVSWQYLTPSLERVATFSLDWILLIYLRNAGWLILLAGTMHLRLFIQKSQGVRYKYTDKWLASHDKKFLFRNQTWDNIFWSLASGCVVWTGYEAITLWAYANDLLPYLDIRSRPVLGILMALGILLFRQVHFYWTHRFTHWKPLYKAAHYLHHKNINIGPWSGISMHPIEHILYFSGVFLHWVVPSHPLLMVFHMSHTALNPIRGHSGFDSFVLAGAETEKERVMDAGSYYHYLHHRYFTVNFGNEGIPLDKWFGSWHDGSEEAQAAMMARRKRKARKDSGKSG